MFSPSQRSPVSSLLWWKQEDWSPGRFYKTMQYLFRPDRENPYSLVKIPFYLNWKLSGKKFRACAEHYIMARHEEYFARLMHQVRPPQRPGPERWPDLNGLGLSQEESWKRQILLRRLDFAETKQTNAQARRQVRMLAQRGPIRARQMLKDAAQKIPPAKRQFSNFELLRLVVPYRAERQFVWAFLRKEADVQRNVMRNLRVDVTKQLAEAYRYLRLTPQEIADGLGNSYQADKDTAEEFGISENSVRSLLSKSFRR